MHNVVVNSLFYSKQNFLLMKKINPRSKNNTSSKSTCLRMDETILRKRNLIFFERMLHKVAKVYFHKTHFWTKLVNSSTQNLLLFYLNYAQQPYSSWAIDRFIMSSFMITYIGLKRMNKGLQLKGVSINLWVELTFYILKCILLMNIEFLWI